MPESLIFPIRNGHGESNDLFGFKQLIGIGIGFVCFEKNTDLCTPFLAGAAARPMYAAQFKIITAMSKVCEITGKKVRTGNYVSHSNIKTRRKFYPNLQIKKFYIPEEDAWITLRVSTQGIRNISKKGIMKCLQDAEANGLLRLY